MRFALLAALAAVGLGAGPAAAQNDAISGVWMAREGTPSTLTPWISSSDVQTMYLMPSGEYRREIVVEGPGAGGKFIDSGEYRFVPPSTFRYQRHSYVACVAYCSPYPATGPSAGDLPIQVDGPGRLVFIGLHWTRVR
jgi:hypothetical protein